MALYPAGELGGKLIVASFSFAERDSRIRTKPARGRAFVRSGSSAEPITVAGRTAPLTADQMARFTRFWEEELEFGVRPFLIADQRFDGETIEDLDDEDGEEMIGTYWWFCRFGESAPQSVPLEGDLWQIGFELEML